MCRGWLEPGVLSLRIASKGKITHLVTYAGQHHFNVTLENSVVTKVEGNPEAPLYEGFISPKGRALEAAHNDPNRLKRLRGRPVLPLRCRIDSVPRRDFEQPHIRGKLFGNVAARLLDSLH